LAGDPDLLFLDEPTTGFDPSARRSAWEVIRNLRSLGKTIFLTTHYMDEAQELADRVAVISHGQLVAEGPPDSLGGRDTATEIRFALPSGTSVSELPPVELANMTTDDGPAGATAVVILADDPTRPLHVVTSWALERGMSLHDIEVSHPSLEDVYLELTAKADSTDERAESE
jgi:ABC-2 type transport system ATP-binding protein